MRKGGERREDMIQEDKRTQEGRRNEKLRREGGQKDGEFCKRRVEGRGVTK